MSLSSQMVELWLNFRCPEFLSPTPCLLLIRPLESEETWVCTMLSSPVTTEATKRNHNMSKIPEEKNCQPRIQCQVMMSFKNKVEINTFSDEGKRIVARRSTFWEILKTVPVCHVGPQHPPPSPALSSYSPFQPGCSPFAP